MTLTTPGLLFPAISLLLLAYTNRFLVLAQLIRELNAREGETIRPLVVAQITNLRKRWPLAPARSLPVRRFFGTLSTPFRNCFYGALASWRHTLAISGLKTKKKCSPIFQ